MVPVEQEITPPKNSIMKSYVQDEIVVTRSDSLEQPYSRDLTGSAIDGRYMSGDDNFNTMMDTPNALRFASVSFASEEGSEAGGKRRGKKRRKDGASNQACCVAGADGGKNCCVM
jgi:hypothetical protein